MGYFDDMDDDVFLDRGDKEPVRDWFGRRASDSFTFYDKTKKLLDWDKDRKSYSSYMTGDDADLKDTAKLLGTMLRVIGIDTDKTKNTTNQVTDPNQLQIPIHMLKDETTGEYKTDGEMADPFFGAALQNAAQKAMQTNSEYLRTMQAKDPKNFNLENFLFSLINSERVDKKFADRYPGYSKFVQKFKDYKFDKNYQPLPEDAEDAEQLLDLVSKMIRYPGTVTEEELTKFELPLKEIERMFRKTGGIPATTEECMDMALQLAKVIKYHRDPEEEEPEGGDSGALEKKLEDRAKELMESMMSAGHGVGADEDQLKKLEEDINDEEDAKGEFDWEQAEAIDKSETYFKQEPDNRHMYESVRRGIDMVKAKVLARLFTRKSKDQQFSMKGMRSGRLDTAKIAEAKQHVPTIYERYGQVKTDKITVGVLIDESGSMNGSKISKAREAAIFINETFGKLQDVELYIYGHTADDEMGDATQVHIYREPGKSQYKYALGSVRSRSNNRDGHAILASAMRIRKFTQRPGVLLVISDGAPAASGYGGRGGVEDTRLKVKKAEKLGFQVIQIAIDAHVPSEQMFSHFIKMTNIKDLPNDMIAYMSNKVDKLIKERITL